MRAEFAIETPLKFFIILVVAALLLNLLRSLYTRVSTGVDNLGPKEEQNEFEIMELGVANTAQLASIADSCSEIGKQQKPLSKEFGCFIIKGDFSGVEPFKIANMTRNPVRADFPTSANALFVVYSFQDQTVLIKS